MCRVVVRFICQTKKWSADIVPGGGGFHSRTDSLVVLSLSLRITPVDKTVDKKSELFVYSSS